MIDKVGKTVIFQTSTLESRLDQVKHESEQLRLNILEKDKIINAAGKVSSEVTFTILFSVCFSNSSWPHFLTFFQLTTDLKDTVPDSKEKEIFRESEQQSSEAPELVSTAINVSFYKHNVLISSFFLSLRFYVKSILRILEVRLLLFLPF